MTPTTKVKIRRLRFAILFLLPEFVKSMVSAPVTKISLRDHPFVYLRYSTEEVIYAAVRSSSLSDSSTITFSYCFCHFVVFSNCYRKVKKKLIVYNEPKAECQVGLGIS